MLLRHVSLFLTAVCSACLCTCLLSHGRKVPLEQNERRSGAKIAISRQIKSNCIFSSGLKSLEYEPDSWKLTASLLRQIFLNMTIILGKEKTATAEIRFLAAGLCCSGLMRALLPVENRTHLRVHALHLVLLQLELHKVVDDVEKLGRDGLEVLVVVVLDGQRGKDGVVDECRAQVGQHARRVLPRVFIKVLCYEVV